MQAASAGRTADAAAVAERVTSAGPTFADAFPIQGRIGPTDATVGVCARDLVGSASSPSRSSPGR